MPGDQDTFWRKARNSNASNRIAGVLETVHVTAIRTGLHDPPRTKRAPTAPKIQDDAAGQTTPPAWRIAGAKKPHALHG
jgi:hypothetical protein